MVKWVMTWLKTLIVVIRTLPTCPAMHLTMEELLSAVILWVMAKMLILLVLLTKEFLKPDFLG